ELTVHRVDANVLQVKRQRKRPAHVRVIERRLLLIEDDAVRTGIAHVMEGQYLVVRCDLGVLLLRGGDAVWTHERVDVVLVLDERERPRLLIAEVLVEDVPGRRLTQG